MAIYKIRAERERERERERNVCVCVCVCVCVKVGGTNTCDQHMLRWSLISGRVNPIRSSENAHHKKSTAEVDKAQSALADSDVVIRAGCGHISVDPASLSEHHRTSVVAW